MASDPVGAGKRMNVKGGRRIANDVMQQTKHVQYRNGDRHTVVFKGGVSESVEGCFVD